MLQPDIGMLIRGLRESLKETVLPTIEDKAAKGQMRAALHTLERLSRVWDLPQKLTQEDNEDMDDVLALVNRELGQAGGDQIEPGGAAGEIQNGVNDPALAQAMRRNLALRFQVEAAEARIRKHAAPKVASICLAEIQALAERMTRRDLLAAGDAPSARQPGIGETR